jgi:cbb3-type cytochrome oxidase cytochrome c subunit
MNSLLHNYLPFTVLTFVAVALGGLIQIIPTVMVNRAKNVEDRVQQPYTPLELAGRDIYVSEGCYNCHSQMIRTMLPDVLRYGGKENLKGDDLRNYLADKQIVALIAYVQKLGAYKEQKSETPGKPVPLNPDSYRKSVSSN